MTIRRTRPATDARLFGKYRGVVVDSQDPQGRGRLTARVPAVLGDVVSGWASPCVPYTGADAGSLIVPPPGTTVWIEFEAGDISLPIYSGWPGPA